MYTIFSAVLRQQRKGDVMTSFGNSADSAVYYLTSSSLVIWIWMQDGLDKAAVLVPKTSCHINMIEELLH
jgi:hypothetical protein